MTQLQTLHSGAPLETARAATIMLHGRGASAEDILGIAGELSLPDMAYLAPQANGGQWYPQRFTAPLAANEPWLSDALAAIAELLAHLAAAGIPAERTALLGFSQGACLALEYAARNPQRYLGVAGLSGALIGERTRTDYPGSLAGTPVLLGCSDVDSHIPLVRVEESAAALRTLGAAVDTRIYPGMGHTINHDEIAAVRAMLG